MPAFLLPDLGEGLTEAQVISWLVEVGDEVAVDQPVAEVETAKAAVEVPVPFAGVVTARHAEEGATVQVGRPLVTVEPVSAAAATVAPTTLAPATVAPDTVAPAADTADGSGAVLVGYGTREERRRRPRTGVAAPPPALVTAVTPGAQRPVISPLVRRLARERGLDLATVTGSGPDGMVLRRDVLTAPAPSAAPAVAPAAAPAVAPAAAAAPRATGADAGTRRIPLTGVRRTTAEALTRSRREIPEATVWVDVDATAFLAARRELGVSVVALLSRFVVLGVQRFPELNARVEPDAVVLQDAVHLGVAAQTPRGLMVPVVHDAQAMTTRALGDALRELTERARAGTLTTHDLTGGTVTVNNYGVYGVDGSAAIIHHPEVAIVGMGRIVERPWVVDGALAVRAVAQLTLAFDHRACDGGVAGGFLRYVADCVESPVRALADL